MPGSVRKKSSNQRIFEDDENNSYFLEKHKTYNDISGSKVYAYCLMSNHVHLLLQE